MSDESPSISLSLRRCLEHPRTLIVCTRIGRSLGLCPTLFSSSSSSSLAEDLLRQGLRSADEQICLDCLFILCENPRTTEPISPTEFDLLKDFLEMNIDNGSTSFRNQCLSLLKKVRSTEEERREKRERVLLAFHSNERKLLLRIPADSQRSVDESSRSQRSLSSEFPLLSSPCSRRSLL